MLAWWVAQNSSAMHQMSRIVSIAGIVDRPSAVQLSTVDPTSRMFNEDAESSLNYNYTANDFSDKWDPRPGRLRFHPHSCLLWH